MRIYILVLNSHINLTIKKTSDPVAIKILLST